MTIKIKALSMVGEEFSARLIIGGVPGPLLTIPAYGEASPTAELSALGGRINIFDEEITGSNLALPRADGKTTLNLVGTPGPTEIAATIDGYQGAVHVLPQRQVRGWASGDYYMLETDPDTGDLIVEPGRNHRKLYITSKAHGMTAAMIADQAGVSEATVTKDWLRTRPQWGSTPETALSVPLGVALWGYITNIQYAHNSEPYSHWVLLERGGDYRGAPWAGNERFFSRGASGEGFLHATVVDCYGDENEPLPIVDGLVSILTSATKAFLVARNLQTYKVGTSGGGVEIQYSANFLGDNINLHRGSFYLQSITGGEAKLPHHTLYRCVGFNASNDYPAQGSTTWIPLQNHTQGVYVENLQSFLSWNSFMDKPGWRDGFSSTDAAASAGPHPQSMYTHCYYIAQNSHDACVDGGIASRAAAFGVSNGPSGMTAKVLLADNNIAGADRGGGAGFPLQYGFLYSNVAVSAGVRIGPVQPGEVDGGLHGHSADVSLIDNIVMHKADPNNPAEVTAKSANMSQPAVKGAAILFDNTRVHNWGGHAGNAAAHGIDPTNLNEITLQKYAEAHTGFAGATIDAYLTYVRGLPPTERVAEFEMVRQFFQETWGIHVPPHTTPGTRLFMPDYRGEGFRFDNYLNWADRQIPINGDTLNLDGNNVLLGRYTRTFAAILAGGSRLTVSSGKFTVTGALDTQHVEVRVSGQFYSPGGSGTDYTVKGGRLVLTAATEGAVSVSGKWTECLLGPELTIPAEKELVITGGDHFVGWDGSGTATLTGAVAFVAEGGKLGKIQRFKRRGDDPEPTITATVNLTGLRIDTTGLAAGSVHDLGGGAGSGITYVNQAGALPTGVSLTAGKLTYTHPA
ncbi:hypothetical protein PARHAE_02037 [Paracoccus haematequi]|uniref:Uncharacterized protein n=1 Tax=Paracoccus haematequi TaxID=2491866 RepID=A0A447IMT3_9RHOB|nr:hypothetical protein [Paracoccus haematequi]VDS08852.1 hypothetical protein PARHAE_02037 [Paracoccus haematequi]